MNTERENKKIDINDIIRYRYSSVLSSHTVTQSTAAAYNLAISGLQSSIILPNVYRKGGKR